MIGRIIGLASILAVGLALWGVWRQVRRPQPLSPRTPLIGLVMAPITLIVNVVVLRQAQPELLAPALGLCGLGFGVAWGQASRIRVEGERIIAERSVLHLACWAASYAVTQLLSAFASAGWVAGGLTAMFFAAGATIGTNLDLMIRSRRLVRRVTRQAAG